MWKKLETKYGLQKMDKNKETETKLIDDLTVHDLQGKEVLLCHLFYCHTLEKDVF